MLSDVQSRVGPYRIVERLGAGGMGIVYLAEDPRLGRRVALKRVSDPALTTPDARAHLLREAAMAATLNHPNIATVYDVLEEEGRPYIVMEYVPGETLSSQLSTGRWPSIASSRSGCSCATRSARRTRTASCIAI